LYHLIEHLYDRLGSLADLASRSKDADGNNLVVLPTICPESPIFAILSTQPRALAAHCQAAGFVVRPVVAPTVPAGTERVRICLHSGNTDEQIDEFIDCVKQWIMNESSLAGQAFPAATSLTSAESQRLLSKL
jgi:8-amino-7-oxononanoate synthase